MADKDFRVKNGIIVGANAHIEGSITSVDSIQLDTLNPIEPLSAGQMSWNEDSNTVSVGLVVGSVELGQEEHIYIKNQSGNTIGKGNTVMFTGTVGASGRILGDKAVMDGTYPSSYFIGIAKHDIANGDDGYVTSFGKIDQLDTSMFSEGDILYADPATPGGLSNTAPVAPNNYVTAAAVVHSDATTGVLFVRPTYEGSIEDKEDVFINSIQDGEALIWRSANARFENGSAGSALELYAENPSVSTPGSTAPSATGTWSVAIGNGSVSSGASSIAIGTSTQATDTAAIAIGGGADALSKFATAIGANNGGGGSVATTGWGAMALGGSYASGTSSLAAAIATNSSSYGATGSNSIAMGYQAKATGQYASAIGYRTQSTGAGSTAIGWDVDATGNYSTALGASSSTRGGFGKLAYSSGGFDGAGDCQTGIYVLKGEATAPVLTTDGGTPSSTNQINLPSNSAFSFLGTVVAFDNPDEGSDVAAWKVEGLITQVGSTTTLVNSAITVINNAPGWTLTLSADATNDALKIEITGSGLGDARCAATIHTTEVQWG